MAGYGGGRLHITPRSAAVINRFSAIALRRRPSDHRPVAVRRLDGRRSLVSAGLPSEARSASEGWWA